ncbi:P-type DNA transfer ATPase VirB11 [Achromobacter mucicolens]|uniref:P-type DNA transfer ATPase VirB11 n=1 Tax=Achromobacter mucicolens TaxID=1389922 RepID=UPI001466E483|nr:P-type DNA transfer ATPase VirB11 [Achromobacter mucicolens]MDG9971073.1 P-type DNA transfer ATPase VirB11 [Achromobacter mucicolens]CAB3905051.1 Type IV secretion system protein VirB11 [Achromobacter mucicolens]
MKDSSGAPPVDSGGRDTALRQMMRPISGYMADDAVREITITKPGVIFTRALGRWHEHHDPKLTYSFLEALVSAMASFNSVNFSPIMSLLLPDGERAQVGQPPAVIEGTISINIRKHSSVVKTLDELAAEGAFANWVNVSGPMGDLDSLTESDKELLDLLNARDTLQFLRRAVLQCRNIIVAGKTGSGKTTFARSLIDCVPFHERLLTVEDVHELFLPNHPNRVHMIYGKGAGRMSATECIEAAMRSSPDRIFLSELRGPEAWDYLNALNTGHPGSVTTTHANSAPDSFERVALLVKQSTAGNQMDLDTIRRYLFSTLDISLYFADYKLTQVYFNPARKA